MEKIKRAIITVTFERDYSESINEMLEDGIIDREGISNELLQMGIEDMNRYPAWLKDECIKTIIE